MRYYGICSDGGMPHVMTVFTDRNEARNYDRDECYTELEMRSHPDLAAALARFEDPTNHDMAVAGIKQILGGDLHPDVEDVGSWMKDVADWATELPPSDPSHDPVMELLESWATFNARRRELLEGWDPDSWNGPRAELTVESERRQEQAREREAQKVYDVTSPILA